ncbi:ferritin-like domain-containing protein [Halopelagius fulvigenes]|uniref:Ferritin-like domain-containing protein n=1 Tax=Halopelagius fulvigenes TaxID=1198324 RepID=A0ABD5U0S9_9EURY
MALETSRDLFVYNLKEMYYIENQLVEMLDELASDTPDEKLAKGFADHRDETRRQVERLETVFREIHETPETRESGVLDGLKRDHEEFKREVASNDLKTPYHLAAGIKTERMEITGYQGLIMLANEIDFDGDVKGPLKENLDEEEDTLQTLTTMQKGSNIKKAIQNLL